MYTTAGSCCRRYRRPFGTAGQRLTAYYPVCAVCARVEEMLPPLTACTQVTTELHTFYVKCTDVIHVHV